MRDKFENLIKTQTESRTGATLNKEKVWKRVESKLRRKRIRRFAVRLSVAASLLILITGGAWLTVWMQQCDESTNYHAQVSGELAETEFYFARLIAEKQQQIDAAGFVDKRFFEPFFEELNLLDKQYQDYKTELKTIGYQEELIRAMIDNQHQKLDLLNRLLIEIQKINNYENRKKEHQI
ncbi:MAG: hypothetical protein RBR47_10410 [Bacteroidales bacterium]|jgi:hypothetical protein|nr:hypothetical protein [Bacteroidales bacterium]MDD3527070.1 hypothetical protein [Bacteroidales bacterium]MDD4176956.1 hypothetical protein [Bacteroidales bacterium]MDD4742034.1 hypothetical protein [Bacteroidales bacterium]MDY0335357.1 hypothetical protein [Bacteroidales bacterium]